MRVIGVVDLAGGLAVHARGGARHRYATVQSPLLGAAPPGDALALAHAYHQVLGLRELYVADLDAITGGAPQRALLQQLAAVGVPLLVDAGVTTATAAHLAVAAGAARVVVGLETLPTLAALAEIASAVGGERTVFSLDLREGAPLVRAGGPLAHAPVELARRAADAGVGAVILLDVARVGAGRGVDLELVVRVRQRCPAVELLVGGGVGGRTDLARLADAGVDGALVATALLDGRLGADDLPAVERDGPR